MNNTKTCTIIDCTEFNNWGYQLLNDVLGSFLGNEEANSISYFHVVMTIFAVEALTDLGNFDNIHYTWLTEGYAEAVVLKDTPEFKQAMLLAWNAYKQAVYKLLNSHMYIDTRKAYTSDFIDANTLRVSDVSVNVVTDSVERIF